ncbi:MAG: LysR substrate-binding domain-containing protein [Qingshengfaniella sp.]
MDTASGLPNLRHLLGIVAIADQGTLSAAADVVNLSQPALTQGIAKIESRLGMAMFRRSSRGMALTDPGRLFVDRLRRGIGFLHRAGDMAGQPNLARLATLGQMRALGAVVDHGGFRAAASALGVEPSSVSRAFRDLEQNCAAPLLEKTSAGMRPTLQAERMARLAKLAIREVRQALDDIQGWQGRYEGRLAIGCLPLVQPMILPEALVRFAPEFPNVAPQVIDGLYASLARGLREGELDMVIGALRSHDLPDGLVQRPLFNDSLVLVARPGHPLADTGTAAAADLSIYPWVAPRLGAPARAYFEDLMASLEIPAGVPRPIETGAHEVMRGLLMRSDRLTVISAAQVEREIRLGQLVRIPFPLHDTRREIGVTLSEDWLPSAPHRRFLSVLAEVVAETVPMGGGLG